MCLQEKQSSCSIHTCCVRTFKVAKIINTKDLLTRSVDSDAIEWERNEMINTHQILAKQFLKPAAHRTNDNTYTNIKLSWQMKKKTWSMKKNNFLLSTKQRSTNKLFSKWSIKYWTVNQKVPCIFQLHLRRDLFSTGIYSSKIEQVFLCVLRREVNPLM